MTPAEVIEEAKKDKVLITLADGGIKLAGPTAKVKQWSQVIAEHKAEIVSLLSDEVEVVEQVVPRPAEIPGWCNPNCSCFEEIVGIGPGCVQDHGDMEQWRRLDLLPSCLEVKR
ncbi:MAG: hypothetical protein ACLFV2_01380 [Desulfurivibrionaceae bacterium]